MVVPEMWLRAFSRFGFSGLNKMDWTRIGWACAITLATGGRAHAQVAPQDLPTVQRRQNEIQRHNETKRRRIEQKNKSGATRKPQAVPKQNIPVLPSGKSCFRVGTIKLKGVTLLSKKEQAGLVAPYLKKCVTLGEINNLLRAITDLYTQKGYVTARGFVLPQDVNDGTFEIQVVEGFIEGYELHDDKSRKAWRLGTAFPFMRGKPLNLRDLEQGLDQINRLKSNDARLKLKPGSRRGGTLVRIDNRTTSPWHFSTALDNSGKKSTGRLQWNGAVERDDLLGINDYLSLRWSKDLQKGSPAQSRSWSGFWSVPFGYLTLSGSSSFFTYASKIIAPTASYVSRGYSRTHKLELNAVVHRDRNSKSNATVFLRHYTAGSFIDDLKLDSSSYRLTSIGLTLGYTRRVTGGVFSGDVTYEKGIRALAAKEDKGISDPSTPRAQFHKLEWNLSFYKPFQVFGQKLSYTGSTHGQWSPMTLYSPDQISIGGASSVRGFHEYTLGGDSGAYVQNTVAWALPRTGIASIDKVFGVFSPFVGYDLGALKPDAKDATEKGVISGYAVGLKTSGAVVSLAATYARHLRSPAHLKTQKHDFQVSVSLNF